MPSSLIEQQHRVRSGRHLGGEQRVPLLRAEQRQSTRCLAVDLVLGAIRHTLTRLIDDESYRRRILIQLNRGENRHRLARVIFHGRRGELRQRHRDGQEDQLGSLGLVVNVVVLWNTIYMDAALNQLRTEGYEVKSEDIVHLSPLRFGHINMLGRYAFTLPEIIAHGELRPLRDPTTAGIDNL